MTMVDSSFSDIIFQKSSTVSSIGPVEVVYSLGVDIIANMKEIT